MFEFNGYVYGGKPRGIIKVKNIKILDDKMMILEFSTGERRLFDASVLEGPAFEPLNDEAVFKGARVEFGVVTWAGGTIDCAPEYMYDHSYEYADVS